MPIDDKYVDYAVEYANKYFPQTVETGGWARVAGRDEAETAEILDYLRKKDFGDVNGRATISAILQDLVGGIEIPANPEAATRDVVYFSGANGSKDTLIKAANEGTLPEVKAVLDDPKIFNGNFARFKELFHKYQTMFTGPEPYGKWRAVMSGIDNGMKKFCQEKGVGQIIDNDMAPAGDTLAGELIAQFHRLANKEGEGPKAKLRMFAVALTPDQAAAEAAKIGVSENEARQNAQNFAAFFPTLQREFDDITLYDRDMQVIYKQRDHQVQSMDAAALGAWKRSTGTEPPLAPSVAGISSPTP